MTHNPDRRTALVGLAVGQRPQPRAVHAYLANFFLMNEVPKTAAPLGRNYSSGMVGESCEDRDFVSRLGPVISKFSGAGRWGAHFGREVLGDVKDFHATVEGTAKIREWRYRAQKELWLVDTASR